MKFSTKLTLLPIMLLGAANANAVTPVTSLSGAVNVDNVFAAYLSTDDSVLGTPIGSGTDWPTTYSFSHGLTPGVTNYLHVVATNQGGPGGFLGQFTLSDTSFTFSNGGQMLNTDTTNWLLHLETGSGWATPTVTPVSEAANGTSPWGLRTGYADPQPTWIWSYDSRSSGDGFTIDFSTRITPVNAVPVPAALWLLAGPLGFIGLAGAKRRQS